MMKHRRIVVCLMIVLALCMSLTSALAGSRCPYCGSVYTSKLSTDTYYYIRGGNYYHNGHYDDEEILQTITYHQCDMCDRNFDTRVDKVVGRICSVTGEYI